MSKSTINLGWARSLRDLAQDSRDVADHLAAVDDWMSRANAESALALSKMADAAADHADPSGSTANIAPSLEELKAPLLAAVGAADLALERVNEIVAALRERADQARTDAEAHVEERRARLAKLQEDLPSQFGEMCERLTSDELRKFAEGYADAAQTTYNKLVERGEAALKRLRNQPAFEDVAGRVEGYTDQAVELTQEALGNVASQTRAVGERASKLVGVELPKKAPAKKAPAKKAAARKVTQK